MAALWGPWGPSPSCGTVWKLRPSKRALRMFAVLHPPSSCFTPFLCSHLIQKVYQRLDVHPCQWQSALKGGCCCKWDQEKSVVNLESSLQILLHLPCALKHGQKWAAHNMCTKRKEIFSVRQEENEFFSCFGTDVFSWILPGMLEAF